MIRCMIHPMPYQAESAWIPCYLIALQRFET
jgi:hypothetical protein